MSGNASHVKQLLTAARMYRRPDMLQDIVREVRDTEASSGQLAAELRVLCAEVAVELKQWGAAAELLKGVGAAQETRLLAVRRIFCEVLVALHHVDENTALTEEEKAQEYVGGAASVLQALAEGVEAWPDSLDAVLTGIRTLWAIVSPLLASGHDSDVCDAVVFLATLHQQLRIGGGYTLVQWLVRAALCLRATERYADAAARFSAALEAAALLGNQHLFVQVLRLASVVFLIKEKTGVSSKTRTDLLPSYRGRPVHFAVLVTQLVLGGQLDLETCREDLQTAYDSLNDGVDAPPPPPDAGAPAVRGKKKQATTKPPPTVRLVDAFAITDPEVVDEVKVDVLFCISLHGTLSPEQVEELERKRSSSSRRVRSFAIFALVVRDARRHGLSLLRSCADAASITPVHKAELRTLAMQLVGVLKNTNAIHDESERQHTLRVGAVLLWNLVLPFLQSTGLSEVQTALSVVTDVSQASLPALRELFLQAATRQCQAAYDEDNRSVLHHLMAIAQRECERGEADGAATAACSFRLQWMDHQMSVRDELESSLTTAQERCLFALEQARWISNPLKRIPVIKTAFRHLPPIVQDVDAARAATDTAEAVKAASGGGGGGVAPAALVITRRSTVQLYRELLDLCLQDLSPSLHAVAMAVAEALRCLPGSPAVTAATGAADSQVEEVRAAASLQAATILARQVEEAETHVPATEGRCGRADGSATSAGDDREARLAALLTEAAQRGVELENRHSGHGSWITANACATFLNWKKPAHARGEYRAHLTQLLEVQKLYATLFERQQAQDFELLADLTSAAVLGLAADFLATLKPSPTSPKEEKPTRDGSAALVQRLRLCQQSEPQNPQLRRAHALCSDALHLIPSVKQKWFLAMLLPVLSRLISDKAAPAVHPQEQLLMVLGTLAGPAPASDKLALLFSDARPLLRKDPCVRLCAWVAAVAVQLRQEEVSLECCEMADRLYASGRLGWGTMYDLQTPNGLTNGTSAVPSGPTSGKAADASGGGGGNGFNAGHKKGSAAVSLVAREAPQPYPKPDAEDWGAYAELLSIKAQVGVEHLQGLAREARSRAVQLLLTTCVNSVIASIHGPAASKAETITGAYSLYYTLLRTARISLSAATFALPSLRMLLSKAMLAQLPKRNWSDVFTNVVYQLSSVLMYVSYSSSDVDDARQLEPLLRTLRDLLPPRYQKSLRVREVTEACHRNPSVEDFLQASRNMEADLQARGWMIVGNGASDAGGEAEAFALALAAAQGNGMATAQCLFEHAYAAMERHGDSTPLTHVTALLQEALRTLEGLPESAPLLHIGSDQERRWTSTLVESSLTATFLSSETRAALLDDDDERTASGTTSTMRRNGTTTAARAPRRAPTTKVTGVTFQHLFLALRIVTLLFRTLPVAVAGSSKGTVSAAQRTLAALESRRDCAFLMLDYVRSLWHLCAKWVRESVAEGASLDLHLPSAAHLYYGYIEPPTAARMVRRCVADEEFQLNTEGLWQSLLELGDYLVSTGDEPHCFAVYSWVRFAAALAFGGAAGDSRCSIVQRLCNWKMCAAASASGLDNGVYMTALTELADAKPLIDEAVRRDLEEKRSTPSWEAEMVLGECELRCQLGETEEAVVIAKDVLCRADECSSWAAPDIRARALRIRAAHEETCSHYGAALRTLQAAFDVIAPTPTATSAARPLAALRHWVEICGDRFYTLMASSATVEAVQCAALVRKQLLQWQGAVSGPALSVHAACTRAEVQAAMALWIRRLLPAFALQFSLDAPLASRPAFSSLEQRRAAAHELLQEIVLMAEKAQSPHGRFAALLAQWHTRGRVTPLWVAENGENVDEVRRRIQILLAELPALRETLQQLRNVRAAWSPGETVSQQASADSFAGSSLGLLAARLNFWTAIDRMEVSTLASCLLAAFRKLTMADLRLPSSSAPGRCEKEVLRFIRGAVAAAPAASAAADAPSPFTAEHGGSGEVTVTHAETIGERWRAGVTPDAEELEQALRHYGIDGADAATMLDVASVPALLETAAAQCSAWPHTRSFLSILVGIAQVEVLRRLESQLERADDLVGVELQSRLHGLLTAAWRRAHLVPPRADKPGSRARKSMATGKRRSLGELSPAPPVRPLSESDQELLQRISLGVEEAAHHGHFDTAAQLSSELSHIAALLDRPQIAAAAAEQTQTNQLVGLLWRCCVNEMMDCPEGRALRQMRAVPPAFTNSRSYMRLVDLAVATTPMERGVRGCGLLCVETEDVAGTPLVNTPAVSAKSLHAAEVSPYAIDTAVLSVAVDNYRTGSCVVTLRHPDGVVEGRRRLVRDEAWVALNDQVRAIEARKLVQLCSADGMRAGSQEERVTAEDLAEVMKGLNEIADELFGEFQPTLQQYCEKTPLYLCVAPELQTFPWEQTTVLGCCSAVLRELGAATIISKLGEPQRGGKRGSQQQPKSASGSAATKSPAVGPMLCFIDVFGDHRDSVLATVGPDLAKSKVAPQHLVTCSTAGSAPDAGYLAWLLRSTVPGSFVVNMCGSLADAVPWPHLASLNFAQLNGVVLADGAANSSSQQREERERLAATLNPGVERVGTAPYPRWIAQALFLLRGAKFVAANTFPCSPAAADVLARRCLASASSGKALVEQLRGKTKDAKTPYVTLFGVLGAGSTKGKA